MPYETQAEIFIRTLTELHHAERKRQKARLRLQVKANVKRFVDEFRIHRDDGRYPPEWTPRSNRSTQEAVRQMSDG